VAVSCFISRFCAFAFGMALMAAALSAQEAPAAFSGPDPAWLRSSALAAHERLAAVPAHQALWKASLVAVAAATVLDTHSSWQKLEANPLLASGSGRFETRAVLLKGLVTGGALGAQWVLVRHRPQALRMATWTNFAVSALYGTAAVHNYRNSR
jgi:hypothetical protein